MIAAPTLITVLLADPNDSVRARLRNLLSRDDRFRVVGEAVSAAPAAASKLQPDLVIIDPAGGGAFDLDLLDAIHQAAPHSRLAVVTDHFDLQSYTAAVGARLVPSKPQECGGWRAPDERMVITQ